MPAQILQVVRVPKFPDTRYMGSKQDLLDFIWETASSLRFQTVLDAFSGSGCVGYMFKEHGKSVIANDHLQYAYHIANATIANSTEQLDEGRVAFLLKPNRHRKQLIQRTFRGLYFSHDENRFLDNTAANIAELDSPFQRSLAISALCRACVKRRPRGVFTYVGLNKYDDGRRDLRMSLREHFLRAVDEFNTAVFENEHPNFAYNEDVFDLEIPPPGLVYMDPPYVTPHSDNDYLRRYHFVEGLATYWRGREVEILQHTKTKKLRKYPTPFDSKRTVYTAFDKLFAKFANSKLLISYSSNSLPKKEEMVSLLRNHRRAVSVELLRHRYSFGTHNHKVSNPTNVVDEYLFVAE
jgi:DNA adenine methylase